MQLETNHAQLENIVIGLYSKQKFADIINIVEQAFQCYSVPDICTMRNFYSAKKHGFTSICLKLYESSIIEEAKHQFPDNWYEMYRKNGNWCVMTVES